MTVVLALVLAVLLLLIVVWRRHLDLLAQLAGLVGGLLLLIWLQDNGYLGGDGGHPPPRERPPAGAARP